MPREQVLKARQARNAALVDAMVLAAAADGSVSQLELQTLIRRVIERPEFEGTSHQALRHMVEASFMGLSRAKSLEAVLQSLRARLPDHKNRMLAFGLAAAVAFSDQRATQAELGLLKTFQAALGISEDEVAQVVDVVEGGGSLSEALGESTERLYAEVMVLVTASDGRLRPAEARAVVENLVSDPAFNNVSSERAQVFVGEAVAALAEDGLPRRLTALAHGLTTHAQRLKAFEFAARVAQADGHPSRPEQRMLDLLQATFGLADDEVQRVVRSTAVAS